MILAVICMTHFLGKCRVNSEGERGGEGGGETSWLDCFVNMMFSITVLIVSIKQGRAIVGRLVLVI